MSRAHSQILWQGSHQVGNRCASYVYTIVTMLCYEKPLNENMIWFYVMRANKLGLSHSQGRALFSTYLLVSILPKICVQIEHTFIKLTFHFNFNSSISIRNFENWLLNSHRTPF